VESLNQFDDGARWMSNCCAASAWPTARSNGSNPGRGELTRKLTVYAHAFSPPLGQSKIEARGGACERIAGKNAAPAGKLACAFLHRYAANIANPFANCFKIPELKSRILFTLIVLGICRVAAMIPIPRLNGAELRISSERNATKEGGGCWACTACSPVARWNVAR